MMGNGEGQWTGSRCRRTVGSGAVDGRAKYGGHACESEASGFRNSTRTWVGAWTRVRRGTTLFLTDGEHRVARLIPEPDPAVSGGGLHIAWSGRRLKKTKPRARLRGGGSMADIVRENRR